MQLELRATLDPADRQLLDRVLPLLVNLEDVVRWAFALTPTRMSDGDVILGHAACRVPRR